MHVEDLSYFVRDPDIPWFEPRAARARVAVHIAASLGVLRARIRSGDRQPPCRRDRSYNRPPAPLLDIPRLRLIDTIACVERRFPFPRISLPPVVLLASEERWEPQPRVRKSAHRSMRISQSERVRSAELVGAPLLAPRQIRGLHVIEKTPEIPTIVGIVVDTISIWYVDASA